MAIIGALPVTLTNGTTADATQVMQDLSFIVSQVNVNAAALLLTPQLSLANVFAQPQTASAATSRLHLPRTSQVQDNVLNYLTGVAGTNAVTGNASISPGAYVTGAVFWFIPAATNTAAVTLNINGLGAQAVQIAGNACTGGELRAGKPVSVLWSGSAFQIISGCWGGGRPLATYVQIAGATTPADVLLCYGQTIAQAGAGADLFARIGTTYGSGGAGTFNLPDMRGRVVVGKDDMGGAAMNRITGSSGMAGTTLGAVGGNELTQAHSHGSSTTGPAGSHTHSVGVRRHEGVGFSQYSLTFNQWNSIYDATATSVSTQPDHTHSYTTANFGSGASQNVQPSMIANIGIVW